MKLYTRAALAGAAALIVAALLACRPAGRPGPRAVAPRAPQTFPDPTQTYWPPDEADRKVVARIEAKTRVADDVIAGRLSLLPAAAAFRDMQDPKLLPALLDSNRGAASIDEVYCRSVIGCVGARPSDRAKEVARRLEAELSARLRDGTLHLPEQ